MRPYRTVVRSRTDPQRRVDARTPGFATAIDVGAQEQTRPRDAVGDTLSQAPGVAVRSLGGLGQFASVSVRGSTPQQVGIFLDGVPVASSLGGLVDLGQWSLDGLGSIEVYRGHVPIDFGGGAIGGAVNLVSRVADGPPRLSSWGGFGSFLTREAGTAVTTPLASGWHLGARATYSGTRGNFAYFDHRNTHQRTNDDRTRRRSNNGYDRVAMQLHIDRRRGPTALRLRQLFSWKQQGVPGWGQAQTRATRLQTIQARSIAHVDRRLRSDGTRLRWIFGLGTEHRRYDDALGEVGLGADAERTTAVDVFIAPRLRLALGRSTHLQLVADGRHEWVTSSDDLARTSQSMSRTWLSVGAELEQQLFARHVLLVPAVRVDGFFSKVRQQQSLLPESRDAASDLAYGVSPRLGARWTVLEPLQLRATFGRYFRPPTLGEMFGDRGYLVGTPDLRPERGLLADGGVVLDVRRDTFSLYGQVAVFWVRSADLITFIPTAAGAGRYANVGAAVQSGLESALVLATRNRDFAWSGNYTLLRTEDRSAAEHRRGQPLPGRPRHQAFTRAEIGHAFDTRGVALEPRLRYTVELVSDTWLDPSGRYRLPARLFHSIGAEVHLASSGWARRVSMSFEVRNLLDRRTVMSRLPGVGPVVVPVADFLGYPLPGRAFWLSLKLDAELLPQSASRTRNRAS